jgi:hypothetical protein
VGMSNINLPPLGVYVRNEFTHKKDSKSYNGKTFGRLIGARSLSNQAMQFQVLLETGALFTGLPANAICFEEDAPDRELIDCQMWDTISSDIELIQFKTLLYMPCTVKLKSEEIIEGEYLFSIDHIGDQDLSRDPTEWKMFHAIKSKEGNFHIYPQYRIKFLDDALCSSEEGLSEYTFNETIYRLGS